MVSTGAWAVARRRRALAADKRAGVFARARVRSAQHQFVRRNWRLLGALTGLTLAIGFASLLAVPAGNIRSFFAGVVVAGTVATVMFFIVLSTGTAGPIMGDIAEQWTAQELRKLPAGWRLVNHVFLRRIPDIDHVVIGPGGIFAVETKWSGDPWRLPSDERLKDAVRVAGGHARILNLWSELRRASQCEVIPLLVLWGPRGDAPVDRCVVDGVQVIRGSVLKEWGRAIPEGALTREQVEQVWQVLDRHVHAREAWHDDIVAVPPSLYDVCKRVCFAFLVGAGTCVAAGYAIRPFDSYLWWGAVLAMFASASLLLRRVRCVRLYATVALCTTALTFSALWSYVLYRMVT